jgi:hypothetical protein
MRMTIDRKGGKNVGGSGCGLLKSSNPELKLRNKNSRNTSAWSPS